MGHRLSKIYTRTGDKGTTGLGDGSRIEKDHLRMQTIGTVDEVNCHIGLLICELEPDDKENGELVSLFIAIQHDLFDLGGELSVPGYQLIDEQKVASLEQQMDQLNEQLPPLKNFILPGGNKAASQCHLARSVCRRAERLIVSLSRAVENDVESNESARIYLNRLSDLLFICARILARRNEGKEVLWKRER